MKLFLRYYYLRFQSPYPMFRCPSALRAVALSLLLLGSTAITSGCADVAATSQVSKEQHCPGGTTPVIDQDWNPHGCVAAANNVIVAGSDCTAFKTSFSGRIFTTDNAGHWYECF